MTVEQKARELLAGKPIRYIAGLGTLYDEAVVIDLLVAALTLPDEERVCPVCKTIADSYQPDRW